ncbi:trypsin-like peptidase domain-containing protein [Novipirellula artificiosorum]|uniref:Thioredoxin n=1 Tax=Novipirellula artificiosorum TaxID=2528016 RepID=A0A5C6DZS9_9BACT|nr:trypsin-like peptidase domain-containing protein [Novipirellula artificiosorum]TWU40566.1 Thioredoxin [Novipirellula artificiosorum]
MNRNCIAAATALVIGISLAWQASIVQASPSNAILRNAILIDFSSSTCPPCRAMQPVLAQLEQSGVPVRHVDVQSELDLARRYGIRQTPTFVVVVDGKEATRLVGIQSLAQLQSALTVSPAGLPIDTGSQSRPLAHNPTPQTRLAPMGAAAFSSSLTASAATAEAMPSVSVADAVERAQAATVRLRVYDGKGYGAGTGTIVDTHGDEALVLTCGHLFRETKGQGKIEVDLFVGGEVRTVIGQVIDYDAEDRDIALVAIRPGFAIQPVRVIGANEKVQNGQTAFSFGCDRGDDPSRRDTRITGIDKYDQHLGVSNLEIQGAPIDGRSGGGLFDASGCLIGVCNAADYKGDVGIYAGPGTIHWQFDRANLSKLYQEPSGMLAAQNAAPPQRIASLPNHAVAPASLPASAMQPSALTVNPNQEVIIIIRNRDNPSGPSKVMTVAEPTTEFMQMVEGYAR